MLTKLSTKCNAKRNKIVQEAEPIEAAATRGQEGKGGGTANKVAACVTSKERRSRRNGLPYKGNGKMIVILRIRTVIPKYFDSVTRDALGL